MLITVEAQKAAIGRRRPGEPYGSPEVVPPIPMATIRAQLARKVARAEATASVTAMLASGARRRRLETLVASITEQRRTAPCTCHQCERWAAIASQGRNV